ncbi:MAG: sulfatase [Deltaproteobacteria bacterium]|nr:sulfatase [Deltaproteobacteria bacterium]MBN2671937.1 sulfatase [Deltaproteobacteria bacterium]
MSFIKKFFSAPPHASKWEFSSLAVSIPFSFLTFIFIIAMLELSHIPVAMLKQTPEYIWKIPVLAINGALFHFRYHIVYLVHLSILFYFFKNMRLLLFVTAGLWTVAITIYSYFVLTSYVRFQGYWPFIVLYIAASVFLIGIIGAMMTRSATLGTTLGAKLFRFGFPIALLLLGVLMHIADFIVFPNVYPTLHLTLAHFTLIVLSLGFALAIFRFPLRFLQRPKIAWTTIAVFAHLFFLCMHLVNSPEIQSANPIYERYTILGQANMIYRDIQHNDGIEAMNVTTDNFNFDSFNKLSGLPKLPSQLRLQDYNILFVTVESLRYDQTSLYQPKWKNTPVLENLQRNGAFSFEWAFSPSMKTMVSMSSILTMTYPSFSDLSLKRNPAFGRLREEALTVAELLHDNGYQTFRVSHNFANVFTRMNHGFEQGFERNKLLCTNPRLATCDRDIANTTIAEINASLKEQKPFFGWVFLSAPHAYYLPHYDNMPSNTEIENFRQEIRYSDEQLGRIIAHLKKTGLEKSTILIILGDHGEEFKEHGRTQHNSIYMECVNVALVIHIPGVRGTKQIMPTSTAYLFPWLLQNGNAALRAAAYKRVNEDFGPMMKTLDGAVITELLGTQRSAVALLKDDLRIHFDYASNYYELFNIKKDRKERNNIFNENDPTAKQMQLLVQKYKGIRKAKERVTYK